MIKKTVMSNMWKYVSKEWEEEIEFPSIDLDTHNATVLIVEGGRPGVGNAQMAGTSTSRLKSVVSECILSHRTSFRVYYRLILLHLILSHLLTLFKIICMLLLY